MKKPSLLAIFTATLLLSTNSATAQNIYTIAGNGTAGFSGDGTAAINAELNAPIGLAFDKFDNLYIADSGNNRVRKINMLGIITTIAGKGTSGFSGDGGPAINAELNAPNAVSIDDAGNVYIADLNNHCIRIVNTLGVISNVAGNNTPGFSGDGGPSTIAQLNNPTGLYVDLNGSIIVVDAGNKRVRAIANGTISTIAGTGVAGDSGDGGLATAAKFNNPVGIARDWYDNLYISDIGSNRIRKISPFGIISTFAGTGNAGFSGDGFAATLAKLNTPYGMGVNIPGGDFYFADQNNYRIRKITTTGMIGTLAGTGIAGYSGDGGPASFAKIRMVSGVAVNSAGDVFIADTYNNRIRQICMSSCLAGINSLIKNGIIISAFPNSSSGIFTLSGIENTGIIEVFDLTGRLLYKNTIIEDKHTIDLSGKDRGMYFYKITADGKSTTGRLVVE